MSNMTEAGWYPVDDETERWWDGSAWTDATRPKATVPAPSDQEDGPESASAPTTSRNVLGIVALVVAALGFVFACVPGAFILGWILLPIGFVLGIVALFLRGRSRWTGVAAIIVAIVGTIVGVMVFVGTLAAAVDESFGGGEVTATVPDADNEAPAETDAEEPAADVQGSRANPYPFGSTIENAEWTVALTGFNPDANAEVAAASEYLNEEPGDGQQYVIVEATATYNGADEGSSGWVEIDYVTSGGTVVSTWDSMVMGVEPEFGFSTIYAGASDSGKLVFLVPSPVDGLIRVKPGIGADAVFFALP